jgi:carboxymethylenebutenolidase
MHRNQGHGPPLREEKQMTATITIPTFDGQAMPAYRADPGGAPKAAIIVIQEIFGINAGIRRKCDTLAEAGYLAIAPDLFWRMEPGIELDPDVPEEMERALSIMPDFDQDQGIGDIEAAVRFARAATGGGKVGAVGYCLGGRLAYMTAARTDVDASVGYYAVGVDGLLGEKHAIANPLMLHIAGEDGFVDKETQAKMHAGLDDHPKVTLHDYPGEDHGFATEFGKRRSDAAATLADERTATFFAEKLS